MSIVELAPEHTEAVTRFFAELPEGDLTFIKEDVTDPASWSRHGSRWLAMDGDAVTGFVAVLPLSGWSDHVGEVRLVVHPAYRRAGLGRALARHALLQSVRAGLTKLVVELVADQEGALRMFTALGFTGEALLRDHIRDRDGELRDLVMLAHYVEGTWSTMSAAGLDDALDSGGSTP